MTTPTYPAAWTGAWPETAGWYWFYGYPFGGDDQTLPADLMSVEGARLHHVHVTRGVDGVYSAWLTWGQTSSVLDREHSKGVWTPAIMPEPPR